MFMLPFDAETAIVTRYAPNADGYVRVRLSDGTVTEEHRVLMSRALGRALEPDEIVRHLNGDSADNSLPNLMLEKREKKVARRVSLSCTCCGKNFERRANLVSLSLSRGQTQFYCGRACVGKSFGRSKNSD